MRLFVYGTLKRGGRYHDRLCQGALSIRPATVRGHLYDTGRGYPALVLPESSILTDGSSDPAADLTTQESLLAAQQETTEAGDWDTVHGELLAFSNPEHRLPAIDRLEGFRAGRAGLYRRVLVRVLPEDEPAVTAWLYVIARIEPGFRRLPGGSWRE